jgi:anaerobic carbon-monoxide dehydrogenase iron sulfur subunit
MANPIWIARDFSACSGCRRCELACSMYHEGWMWLEASRVRVFMPFPGVEVPHLCAQCQDYPCIESCPVNALSTDSNTGAVLVDKAACISCGACIRACPGTVPYLHPGDNKATICDLCGGEPRCVEVCTEAGYNALTIVNEGPNIHRKLYSRNPKETAKDLAVKFFGEKGEEVIE